MEDKIIAYLTDRNLSEVTVERKVNVTKMEHKLLRLMMENEDEKYVASYLEGLADYQRQKQ